MSQYQIRHFSEYYESTLTEKIQRLLDSGCIPVQLNVMQRVGSNNYTDAYLITKEPEYDSDDEPPVNV